MANGVGQVTRVGLLDEVSDGLRVRLGDERVATFLQPVAERAEVLDDPVVDDRDVAGAVLVRVSVQVVRSPVRRPAGVGQTDRSMRCPPGDGALEVHQLAGSLLDEQVAGVIHEGDARRIVAPVLQASKTLDQDRSRLVGSRIADDAAHGVTPSARAGPLVPAGRGDSARWAPTLV